MNRSVKAKATDGTTRDLFAELREGFEALAQTRQRKRSELMRSKWARRDQMHYEGGERPQSWKILDRDDEGALSWKRSDIKKYGRTSLPQVE